MSSTPLTPTKVYPLHGSVIERPILVPDFAALVVSSDEVIETFNTQGTGSTPNQFNNQEIDEFAVFWHVGPCPPNFFKGTLQSGGQIYCVTADEKLYQFQLAGEQVESTIKDVPVWRHVTGDLLTPVSVGASLYAVDSSAGIRRISKMVGGSEWSVKWGQPGASLNPPAVDQDAGLLYYSMVESGNYYIRAAHLSDGSMAWKTLFNGATAEAPSPVPAGVPLMALGGSVLVPLALSSQTRSTLQIDQSLPGQPVALAVSKDKVEPVVPGSGEGYPSITTASPWIADEAGAVVYGGLEGGSGIVGRIDLQDGKIQAEQVQRQGCGSSTSPNDLGSGQLPFPTPVPQAPGLYLVSTLDCEGLTKIQLPGGTVEATYDTPGFRFKGPPVIGSAGEVYATGCDESGKLWLAAFQLSG